MPAVYAIAEIANSTDDPQVKIRALNACDDVATNQLATRYETGWARRTIR
jgi:hypothetical protein